MVRHIGQRHVIPLQKGKPGIVVLKIQCLTHPLRHLVDKAENTLIVAGTVIVHQPVFKFNPQILLIILIDFQKPFFPVRFFQEHLNIFILHQILVIKNIPDFLPVNPKQRIPFLHLHLLRNASLQNLPYHMSFHFRAILSFLLPTCRILPNLYPFPWAEPLHILLILLTFY